MNNRLALKRVLFCFLALIGSFFAMSVYIYYMSRFLDKVGPQNLPLVTIASSLAVMLYSIFNSVASRMKAAYTYVGLLFALAAGCFFLGQQPNDTTQVFLLYLISLSCLAFFDISLINLATSVTTPLQAKLLLPYVSAFTSVGIILASYSISRLSHIYETYSIPMLMTALLLLLAVSNLLLIRLFKKDFQAGQPALKAGEAVKGVNPPVKANSFSIIKETLTYVFRQSRLFRTLAIVVIVLVAVQIKSEFKVKTTLALNYTGDELTSMISLIYLLSSAGSFLMNAFLTKKLLFYFGVSNLLLFYPLWLLFVLAAAMLLGLGPLPAVIYFLAMAIPIFSFIPISISQIYSIAPRRYSNSIYFFIRGILWSLSTIFFSALLLIYSTQIELEKYLNTLAIFVLLIIMAYGVYKMRFYYLNSLHDFLFRNDDYLKTRAIELFAEKTHKEHGETYLRVLLSMPGTSEETKLKVMNSLAIIGNYQTIADLIQILDSGSIKEKHGALTAINSIVKDKGKLNKFPVTKHLLLGTYERLFISNIPLYLKLDIISSLKYFDLEDIILFLEKSLSSDDPAVRENAIETLGSYDDRSIIIYLKPFLNDSNGRVVCAAVVALWKFKEMRIHLIQPFSAILEKTDENGINDGLYLINSLNATWEKNYVIDKLDFEATHIRMYALLTLLQFKELSYLKKFINEWLEILRKENKPGQPGLTNQEESNFILSRYFHLNPKIKAQVIRKIQLLPEEDTGLFLQAYKNSMYHFYQEIQDLS